jgi:hypothetical protein
VQKFKKQAGARQDISLNVDCCVAQKSFFSLAAAKGILKAASVSLTAGRVGSAIPVEPVFLESCVSTQGVRVIRLQTASFAGSSTRSKRP